MNDLYAAVNNPAINDLLDHSRYEGAMSSISWLTSIMDQYTIIFISLVSFLIISAALMRNVVAGAYAAWPKAFDWVAAAKESLAGHDAKIGGMNVSFLMKLVAFLIPNVKAISDFHDDTVEPKHYFLVAIPKMIGIVMIGVIIFNGYYRDLVINTSTLGSTVIVRALAVDPVATMDRVLSYTSTPSFASDGDNSTVGEYTNKVSKSAYRDILSFYNDIKSSENRLDMANKIEAWVSQEFASSVEPSYWDDKNYDIKFDYQRVFGMQNLNSVGAGDTEGTKTYAFQKSVLDLALDSQEHVNEDYVMRVIVRFEKKADRVESSQAMYDMILVLPIKTWTAVPSSTTDKQYTFDGKGYIEVRSKSGNITSSGGGKFTVNGQTIALVMQTPPNVKDQLTVTGINYVVENSAGVKLTHSISTIKFQAGLSAPKLQTKSGTDVLIGEDPTAKE